MSLKCYNVFAKAEKSDSLSNFTFENAYSSIIKVGNSKVLLPEFACGGHMWEASEQLGCLTVLEQEEDGS